MTIEVIKLHNERHNTFMYRSFSDRVLGGVCGGLGETLRLNPWWLRAAFIILSLLSAGLIAALYLILWWILPQESLANPSRSNPLRTFFVLVVIVAIGGGWVARASDTLQGPSGQGLLWPAVFLLMSTLFFLRQVRG
jgi:phage shock protein PspC (stress-responsive transcriptional regulator)